LIVTEAYDELDARDIERIENNRIFKPCEDNSRKLRPSKRSKQLLAISKQIIAAASANIGDFKA